jgi:hypothetical protein
VKGEKTMIKVGDTIIMNGKWQHEGRVLDIKYNKKGVPCSYLVDRVWKNSWVYSNNVRKKERYI